MSRTPFGHAVENLVETLTQSVGSDIDVSTGVPRPDDAAPGIDVTVVSTVPGVAQNRTDRRHLPGTMTCFITVHGPVVEAADLLHDVWAAVDASPIAFGEAVTDPQWWTIFATAPRPCVAVRLPVVVDRLFEPAPMVTQRLRVVHESDAEGQELQGRVLGPQGQVVVGARVVPTGSPARATTTDAVGRFTLHGVFSDPLSIHVEHYQLFAIVELALGDDGRNGDEVVITLEPLPATV